LGLPGASDAAGFIWGPGPRAILSSVSETRVTKALPPTELESTCRLESMAAEPSLIVQVPRGSAVDRQLRELAPKLVADRQVVVEAEPADAGHLELPDVGEIVLSVPSPETLVRERDEVRRVIAEAGPGIPPLVVVVEAAEELRDEELQPVLDAAEHTTRPVILRVIRDG
jgi:hypothetical protein